MNLFRYATTGELQGSSSSPSSKTLRWEGQGLESLSSPLVAMHQSNGSWMSMSHLPANHQYRDILLTNTIVKQRYLLSCPFTTSRYMDVNSLTSAIQNLQYVPHQVTFTASALRLMMQQVSAGHVISNDSETNSWLIYQKNERMVLFTLQVFGGPGDRPEVVNVAVLITDGLPTEGRTEKWDTTGRSGCQGRPGQGIQFTLHPKCIAGSRYIAIYLLNKVSCR